MPLKNHLIHAAMATAFVMPMVAHAIDKSAERSAREPISIDCTQPYPNSVAAAIEAANLRADPAHSTQLTDMLEGFSVSALTALKAKPAIETFDRLATLTHSGLMITSEIVHIEALDALPDWRESKQAALFTRMLQTVYEPYHPDDPNGDSASHDHEGEGGHGLAESEEQFNDALTLARNQVIEASRRVPGFFDRPVRWYIQGVVYNDPVARQYAAGRICADDALRARLPMINAEVSRIAKELHY